MFLVKNNEFSHKDSNNDTLFSYVSLYLSMILNITTMQHWIRAMSVSRSSVDRCMICITYHRLDGVVRESHN